MVDAIFLEGPNGSYRVTAPVNYTLVGASWADGGVLARVHVKEARLVCSSCGSSDVLKYGRGDVRLLDAPSGGVRTALVVARQRIKCDPCQRLSRQWLPTAVDRHRCTARCIAWIGSQVGQQSNVAIASTIGASEKSIRLIAKELAASTRSPAKGLGEPMQCANCLRLVVPSGLEASHFPRPRPEAEASDAVTLCHACHADIDACWVRALN